MSGWWGTALIIGIGVLLGAIQVFHDAWFDEAWAERVERHAMDDLGLPPITHKAHKWGRTVSVKSVDPDTGKWLWKAHKP